MWWHDLLWGLWNGLTAWIILIAHVFGAWERFPFYDVARSGNWYDFGFLLGAGSPLLGAFGRKNQPASEPRERRRREPTAAA
jgi:hypothetical protein